MNKRTIKTEMFEPQEVGKPIPVREFWAMNGPGWILPLSVEWNEGRDMARVRIGGTIPVLPSWREEAGPMLDQIAMSHTSACWVILRPALEMLASRTTETDPENLVDWRPKCRRINALGPPPIPGTTRSRNYQTGLRKQFWEGFVEETQLPFLRTPAQCEVFWHVLCSYMIHWLVNVQKPVDLLFCRLHPTIFSVRSLTDLFSKRVHWKDRVKRLVNTINRAYGCFALTGPILAWSRRWKVPLWRLEVQPTVSWWRSAIQSERLRRRTLGSYKYRRYVAQLVRSLIPETGEIVETLRAQVRYQNRVPGQRLVYGSIPKMDPPGELVTVRASNGRIIRSFWKKGQRYDWHKGPCISRTLVEKVEDLSALHDLRPKGTYVRHGRDSYYIYEFEPAEIEKGPAR